MQEGVHIQRNRSRQGGVHIVYVAVIEVLVYTRKEPRGRFLYTEYYEQPMRRLYRQN